MRSRPLDWTALTFVIIGAINWGLMGFFRLDLLATIFGIDSLLTRIFYVIIGLAGLYCLSMFGRSSDRYRDHDRYQDVVRND